MILYKQVAVVKVIARIVLTSYKTKSVHTVVLILKSFLTKRVLGLLMILKLNVHSSSEKDVDGKEVHQN